ncbi:PLASMODESMATA CALLOSE-BINDING PROTEIN 3-like isoform X1 [Durio zibethinus]|uniref:PLASMODESMATA CALLOSE-BINDING PROTEIN 3-like isoform X1 n=1 Tax=Durio zibethinus TaxID=66656 RepID=A0A6P6BF78_DURZI|nr:PLASMODESMATA CALLOSE-BINDING PROTEIN 3-like isoform X1 [Durio zibethinus]
MALLFCLVLFLAMTGHSSASYCLCKDGVGDQALQKTLDYACGAGADCTAILQNGGCYSPNTVRDHCNYAVNSYFQRKGEVNGSCDFSGTASISATPPSNVASTCNFPSRRLAASSLFCNLAQAQAQQLEPPPQLQLQGQLMAQPQELLQCLVVAALLAQQEQRPQASMIQMMLCLSSEALTFSSPFS